MATLELFPNLAHYRIEASEEQNLSLPFGLEDITVYKESKVSPTFPDDRTVFHPMTYGEVDGSKGFIQELSKDQVVLIRRDETSYFLKPKKVTFEMRTTGKQIRVKPGDVVTGFISGISWKPVYTVILSENMDKISSLSLAALVDASNQVPFSVYQITFITEPVLAEQKQLLGTAPTVPLDIKRRYFWRDYILIENKFTLPLESFNDLEVPLVYFLTLSQEAKPSYGYIFETIRPIPPAQVKVYKPDFSLIGLTNLEVAGKFVILKVAPSIELSAQTIIERSHPEKESTREVIDYTVRLNSTLNQSTTLVLDLPIKGKVLSADPQPSLKLPGKLLWYMLVSPGESEIRGRVVMLR